jgi:Mannosyl-glycoprotein endo-beta-N-acetylglucosaminidase
MRRVSFAYLGLVGGIAGGLAGLLAAWPAQSSAPGPQLKLSATNTVPACFAPAKLMSHVGLANPKLDPRFRDVAALYESHGKTLGLRWDYAFFQMLAETNNLTFAGARGDLTKDHNNFANIRSADSEAPDRFADIATGVQAHLHHIRLYAGDPVAKPAAKRTKQVESFVLSWSRQLKRPVRFDDMIGRWSPNNPGYARTIEASMKDYQIAHCGGVLTVAAAEEDEQPTRKASRGDRRKPGNRADAGRNSPQPRDEPEQQAAQAPEVSEPIRTAAQAASKTKPASQPPAPPMGLGAGLAPPPAVGQTPPLEPANAASAGAAATGANAQCKVWSASFGGDKSVLIRVNDGQITHFTALQVNAGREKDETSAYIAAYARGGRTVGEFTSADQAINKAFELCPKT